MNRMLEPGALQIDLLVTNEYQSVVVRQLGDPGRSDNSQVWQFLCWISITLSATTRPISSITASSACLPAPITRTMVSNNGSVPKTALNPASTLFRYLVFRLIGGSFPLATVEYSTGGTTLQHSMDFSTIPQIGMTSK